MKNNTSRRDFLKVSAAGAVGMIALSHFACKNAGKPATESAVVDPKSFGIGLQLYTIRDAMGIDVPGSL
ncbi:MAG: twin-arginine translocation signal domain-containing protein, partial [Bacteroidales bacterium]|nr:twin-arginine translocation signal domain-containing protein [Bacteroidales bacterium]